MDKPLNLSSVLGKWLRESNETDRVFPKNKKIEVVFLVEAVNAILPRTEGVEDITLIKLSGTEYEVPVILPEKLQAVARRRMLAQLRRFRDEHASKLESYLKTLANLFKYETKKKGATTTITVGFTKAREYQTKPREWNCYIQPPGGEATDIGMDGFCPACALFGVVIDSTKIEGIEDESIGLKSRVEFDPAIAFLDQEKCIATYTHNKVSDGASWTGQSLFKERHVIPGTVFVGKVTLEDIIETELKVFLAVLAGIDRLGGRERIFGSVRVHLVGVKGGSYETVSALEIARELAKEYGEKEFPPSIEEIKKKVQEILKKKGFFEIESDDYKKLLDDMSLWDKVWQDTIEYDKQVVKRILELVMKAGKFTEA